jgi:hypothetical protein
MPNLLYWGGPVTTAQPSAVEWQVPTKIVCLARDGSEANAAAYAELARAHGYAFPAIAEIAGLDPAAVGSFGIAGFSAFGGFANRLLSNAEDFSHTSFVGLFDACFLGAGATEPHAGYARFAEQAASGARKLMVVTSNGPWDQPLHYCWDYGPPRGRVCYNLTSGAQCVRLFWENAVGARQVVRPTLPASLPEPTLAQQVGNLIWLHYEPAGKDPHGFHVHTLATPLLSWYASPWMAEGIYPGSPTSSASKWLAAAGGAAAVAAAALAWRQWRRRRPIPSTPGKV